jgi:hypothetical protein
MFSLLKRKHRLIQQVQYGGAGIRPQYSELKLRWRYLGKSSRCISAAVLHDKLL